MDSKRVVQREREGGHTSADNPPIGRITARRHFRARTAFFRFHDDHRLLLPFVLDVPDPTMKTACEQRNETEAGVGTRGARGNE